MKKRTRVRLHLNNEDDGIDGAALDDIDQLASEDEARDGVEACLTEIPKYISPTQKCFAKLESDEKQHAVVRDNERQISELERSFEQLKNKKTLYKTVIPQVITELIVCLNLAYQPLCVEILNVTQKR